MSSAIRTLQVKAKRGSRLPAFTERPAGTGPEAPQSNTTT
jgi:hypothetical protein